MQKLYFCLLLIVCLTSVVFPQSTENSPKTSGADSLAWRNYHAAARSLLLPGWGQFYNHQPQKAWRAIAVEGLCIGGFAVSLFANQQSNDDFAKYFADIGKHYSLWALGSAVIVSTVDAWYAASPDTLSNKNPTGAMLRSIFVPGWGQFYNEKPFKGLLIAGTQITFLTNALIFDKWGQQAITELDRAYYYDNRSLYYWLLGASILYSMTDAFVDAHLFDFDESPDLSLAYKTLIDPFTGMKTPLLNLSMSIHF